MSRINYEAIYNQNKKDWKALTDDPQKYEALLAGHYSDSNHFVYELLQNAEDAFDAKSGVYADKVVIEYYEDKLVFYHNGKPFDEADVRGVSSMLMGTKDRDDAQTIGRFGMGFKSVFKYTYQPEIYSDDEAFKITNYLLPVETSERWNCEKEKQSIVCKTVGNGTYKPFANEKHLTKFVIPFIKYGRSEKLETVAGNDVLKKLRELNGEILLFLSHIQSLYWINKETGKYARISLEQNEKDDKLITCRIEGTDYGDKEEITRYLKFKKVFNHPYMENAEVSVAYRLNSRADNINEVEDSPIWVYFPTRDETDLPFLIHGSFETAVSREKLMTPSAFNSDLFDKMGDLIAESMEELARRKLITQAFIRRSLLTAFEDEEENDTIPGLKEKVTKIFASKGLIPDRTGNYGKPKEMLLPIPFRLADFAGTSLIGKALDGKVFVAFNNERELNFGEYFNWLKDDLKIELYGLTDLATDLRVFKDMEIHMSGEQYKNLLDFYDFLSDYRESLYNTSLSFSRSGPYESFLRQRVKNAWPFLRQQPIILNRFNQLVPAEVDNKPFVYLGASSDYKSVTQSSLVNKAIAEKFKDVLSDGFRIQEFNNFQYIKEKVIQKYIDIGDKIAFENDDDFEIEYKEDIEQILTLIDETGNITEVQEMLKKAWIIKTRPDVTGEEARFSRPGDCYVPMSEEGIDLDVFFAPILYEGADEDDPNDRYNFELFPIDKDFYESCGISINKLAKLGLLTTPVDEGSRRMDGIGDNYWTALGEFCPNIKITGLDDNLEFIENYSNNDLAKKKSVEILKLLLRISSKLKGKRRKRQRNPYVGDEEETRVLCFTIKSYMWLYDKEFIVHKPNTMSRFDLNTALYSGINASKEAFEILGFIEKEADETEEAFQKASGLARKDKKILLNQLARELGMQVTEAKDSDEWEEVEDAVFDPNAWQDNEFPVNKVSNIEYLIRHVQEQFYCADPVTYKKVWRQIRISKNNKSDRSYAIGMYTNSGNTTICQMCRKPIAFIEVKQIANYGIEMPQLNLCLCRDCSARYSALRGGNKEEFKNNARNMIMSIDSTVTAEDYSIEFNPETVVHFTQTHIAEVQEIFRLLNEYGTPSEDPDITEENVTGPLMHPNRNITQQTNSVQVLQKNIPSNPANVTNKHDPDTAKEGCLITYKKRFGDYEIYDNVLQTNKYPLHKELLGHKVGDIITFQNKKYEIISIM